MINSLTHKKKNNQVNVDVQSPAGSAARYLHFINRIERGKKAVSWHVPFFVFPYSWKNARVLLRSRFSSAASHGDKDVQVEAVVRLPEEEDEEQAEEAGAGEAPVQPGQVWIGERDRKRDMRTENLHHPF